MEGCYHGFLDVWKDPKYLGDLDGFAADLCGYMYLFNYNRTFLSQYADLGYYQGVADEQYKAVGYYRAPGTVVTKIPPRVLFKDLGPNSAYGGKFDFDPSDPHLGVTLYINMVCAYEHWAVGAPSCSPAGHHDVRPRVRT